MNLMNSLEFNFFGNSLKHSKVSELRYVPGIYADSIKHTNALSLVPKLTYLQAIETAYEDPKLMLILKLISMRR